MSSELIIGDTESCLKPCRLCLREYKNDFMQDIFTEESNLEERVIKAVSVEPSRADPMTHICSNCNALVALIIDFRTACRQANDLLKSETYRTVRSSTWERPNAEETFRRAANLVQEHRYEVKALLKSNKCHVGEATQNFLEDVECEPETPQYLEQDDESPSSPEESSIAARLTCGKRGREKIMCPICGEMVSLETLEGHQNRHAGVQPFTCDIPGCGAKLYSQLALRQHRSRHKSASKFYDCGVCGKRIKSAAYWLIHRKSHTEEPRFSCDICGKKFHRKYKLKQHSTVHSGIAEFQCEICGKYFTIKHNLTAHYKLHARKDQKAMTNRNFNEK
ncbi:zinc finger protein 471 isoform X1 [Culex quinquefasciatus]|uniref:zinc finger protein 471 isoform X1 n=1 Tax=Culex quinquefasciatus TaxID=7176 RepID=UPI0018E37BD4|nr:zinc finger protein 471 isoform X1 [Culex quinquefasciatus]